jgi:hypothetical protein
MLYVFFWVIPRRLNYPEENIQHTEHGESLKSRINSNVFDFCFPIWSLSRLLCCVVSGSNVAVALDGSAEYRLENTGYNI